MNKILIFFSALILISSQIIANDTQDFSLKYFDKIGKAEIMKAIETDAEGNKYIMVSKTKVLIDTSDYVLRRITLNRDCMKDNPKLGNGIVSLNYMMKSTLSTQSKIMSGKTIVVHIKMPDLGGTTTFSYGSFDMDHYDSTKYQNLLKSMK